MLEMSDSETAASKGQTVNKKETKWSKMMHSFFFCFHIRPPFLTFDTQLLDLSFVQPSGASLPSIGIGIPSRCSHPRGFSIVFPAQRKKKSTITPYEQHCMHTQLFPTHAWFSSFPFTIRFHISLLAWWGDCQRMSNTLQTDIKTFGRKYEIFQPPSSLPLWFVTSCGLLVSQSQLRSKCYTSHAKISFLSEHFAGSTTNHICPLALIWLSSPKGIHITHPSSSTSVLHPSLIAIHNNGIKTSVQGLSRIIPDFKHKRYPSWQWCTYVLFSYWQSHNACSLTFRLSLFFVPFALHLLLSPHLALPFSSLLTRRAQYVGSNSGEVRSKVSLCRLNPGRIKARRLLRKGHKVCSCLPGVKTEGAGGERDMKTVEKEKIGGESSEVLTFSFISWNKWCHF